MKGALGRGFDSLIPDELIDDEFDPTSDEDEKISRLIEVDIDKIAPDKDQARKTFDPVALEELAKSIEKNGILQPIVTVKDGTNYKIVAGERRFRAAKILGLKKLQIIVRKLEDQNRLELSIIENAQREDLNPIELATAYEKLMSQFNLETKDIAERVGKTEQSVYYTLRLLRFPDDKKKLIVENHLTEGVLRPLVQLIGTDDELLEKVFNRIIREGMTSREVERFIADNKKHCSVAIVRNTLYHKEEDRISKYYGAKAKIRGRTITITCDSKSDLDNLLKKLG